MKKSIKKVVLAYSGGLDTSVAIPWLREQYRCDVIAFCADIGQQEDLPAARDKALKCGAVKASVRDLREVFVRDYVFPMLRANAVYEGGYLLGTSIARPLIAKAQIELALKEGADAVAHGATGKGNDQLRFEFTYQALAPQVAIIAPWREWSFDSRQALIDYAERHQIPVSATKAKPYSIDRNLFHTSYEGGILENPWAEPPEELFTWTRPAQRAPDQPAVIEIGYEAGDPVSVNGKPLGPVALLERLNAVGSEHGIGRLDLVENRYVGIKSRGVYETPGGTLLHLAHRAVESLTLDREVLHLRDSLIPRYAELVYYGYWFSPERTMLQAAIDQAQTPVTGTARLRLYKGQATVIGRKAPASLYRPALSTFERGEGFDQRDASGFIRLNALRLRVQAKKEKGQGSGGKGQGKNKETRRR
jgi:argininosuccinate synthase